MPPKKSDSVIDLKLTALHAELKAGIDIQANNIVEMNKKLDRILEQTTKTNGRVTNLEIANASHFSDCPQAKRIDDMEKGLLDYNFFQKHPKTFLVGIAIAAAIIIIAFYNN